MIFISFFILFCFQFCYSSFNRTVGIPHYAPLYICDPQDPWNQTKFSGIKLPQLESILEKVDFQKSDLAYVCANNAITLIFDVLNLTDNRYDSFLFFSEGVAIDFVLKLFDVLQPYHDMNYVILIQYNKPSWIFTRYIDPRSLVLFFSLPLIIGLLFLITSPKFSFQFITSDLYGLLFFQPEIFERRNLSHKIISLALKAVALIFFTIFIFSVLTSFRDMITTNNKTLENGLGRVKLWAEDQYFVRVAYTLAIPQSTGYYYMTQSDWEYYLKTQPPNKPYVIRKFMADMLAYNDCSMIILGEFFKISNIFFPGYLTREERLNMNEAIIDTIEKNYDYVESFSKDELLGSNQSSCPSITRQNLNYVYSLSDFKELWFIYLFGVLAATILKIFEKIIRKLKQAQGKIVIESAEKRKHRIEQITSQLKDSIEVSLIWLQRLHIHFYFNVALYKYKQIRTKMVSQDKKWHEKLKKARSKVVAHHLKTKKQYFVRIMLRLIVNALKSKEMRNKSKTPLQQIKKNQLSKIIFRHAKKPLAKIKYHKFHRAYISAIIQLVDVTLKEIFLKVLELNNLLEYKQGSAIEKYIKKKMFRISQKVKLTGENAKHSVNESIHNHMSELFLVKINRKIMQDLEYRQASKAMKKYKTHIQQFIKRHSNKSVGELFLDFYAGILHKNRLSAKSKNQKRLKKRVPGVLGPRPLPKFAWSPNKNKQQSQYYHLKFQINFIILSFISGQYLMHLQVLLKVVKSRQCKNVYYK